MEQLLHYVWKHKIFPLMPLQTTSGQPVEVIDPGLPNTDAGPDFFNAKLKINGTLWVGNVELHTQASDWFRHGHNRDTVYDNVILHVVVEGKVQSLLQTERLMLNIMQRMSGIATMTHKYAEKLKGTNTRVLDTRKTTPGMRILEKMAVKIGGGVNHRIGLFDMILLKDNHVDFAGGIDKAITRAKEYCKEKGKDLKIEIEVRNFDELQQVLDLGGVDRIMFDNFTPAMTKKAVEMVGGRYETESSGGITFDTLRDYAECGVDFISVGALTHSVKGLDMSFKAC